VQSKNHELDQVSPVKVIASPTVTHVKYRLIR